MLKRLSLLLSLLVVSVPVAMAQNTPAPATITFQGRIAKPDGSPVPDTVSSLPYTLRISLWDAPTGGTKKWETIVTVSTKNGVFSTPLEFGANADTALGGNRWIEMKIGNDPPLLPRQQLFSVAYALRANTVPDGAITSEKLADASVLAVKIADLAISSTKIQDFAILTAKLADLAVTAAKLADNAVTRQKIANDAVDNTKLASDSASLSKVSGGGLTITGGNLVVNSGLQVGANVDVQGSVRINGIGSGVRFPDGSLQISANSGVPSGHSILGNSPIPPEGFIYSGKTLLAGASWKYLTPPPAELNINGYFNVCASGDKIYVVCTNSLYAPYTPKFVVYDPQTDTWISKSPPSNVHSDGSMIEVNGHLLLIGGKNNAETSPISTVEEYSPSTDQWAVRTELPTARFSFSACYTDSKLYVFGGNISLDISTRSVIAFDLTTNQWVTKADAPQNIGQTDAIAFQGIIYLRGLAYNTAANIWSNIAPGYLASFGLPTIASGKIVVRSAGSISIITSSYDIASDKWTNESTMPMPTNLSFQSAVVLSGQVYVMSSSLMYNPPTKYYIHTKQ